MQISIGKLPDDQQDSAMSQTEMASRDYPAVTLTTGERLHVFEMSPGLWEVWLNCEDADFTGICVAVEKTRHAAVAHAVQVFEAAVQQLQQPA